MNVLPGSGHPRFRFPALILLSRLGAAAFVLLALPVSGYAQTYDQVAPKTPPPPPPPKLPDNPVLAAPARPAPVRRGWRCFMPRSGSRWPSGRAGEIPENEVGHRGR